MKTETQTEIQRYDVVIYELESMQIDAVIGENMESVNTRGMGGNGRNTAELRRQTGRERINDRYDVAIVYAGKFQKGDKITESDIRLDY